MFNSKDGIKKKASAVVNVASVPHRSPFRYPGGKTWLVPTVRKWLKQEVKPKVLFEPFAGGGIVSLTAAFEKLADKVVMAELDDEIAAVWEEIIHGDHKALATKVLNFELNARNVNDVILKENKSIAEKAFSTILKNRVYHGGIITKGSGLIKNGEKGKGIKSRWYPKTLHDRILSIGHVNHKIEFIYGDAFELMESNLADPRYYFFIDPPYTVAGRRLYTHYEIDHEKLFYLCSKLKGKFMLTYDDSDEVRDLSDKYKLKYQSIPMKTTHHIQKHELIISDNFQWWQ